MCGAAMRPTDVMRFLLPLLLLLLLQTRRVAAEVLTPPYFNLAEGRKITATATCGDEGPELYCKLVGANAQNDVNINVIQGQVCDECDLNNFSKRHPPEYAVDGMPTWWQSPPLSRGMKYNEVNLTIDLGQEFHVAYVFMRMGNSPRPGLWALEKSSDYGKTYTPWQYFSDSANDCETHFGKESLLPITRDDSVICSTEYSKIVPLEGGEIPISLLNKRPNANKYFNSSVLQEWTRATNVRLRLMRTKTLLGHLMSVARQDPTVTRRYFYSIKDISIGGRCMCNGHANTCDIPDIKDPNKLLCRCQHHTCGPQCAKCCPGYEQKKWRQSQLWQKFVCEPCNCFNHSTECVYDSDVDEKQLSLDIHGKYDGGGVCQNCQHNTEGINCNKCKSKFYRPHDKSWNETDVCQPCNCNYSYSTGNCAEGSGQCECREEYQSPYCDSCSYGYYGYPDCKRCICNLNGTDGDFCEPVDESCPCKFNYFGIHCESCAEGYYNFPKCEECGCNPAGAVSSACDQNNGNCICKTNFAGRTCDRCQSGYYSYPTCKYCSCDPSGTLPNICNASDGTCLCKEGFGGPRCDQCIAGYYSEIREGERVCVECHCSKIGSTSTSCDSSGKCICLNNFGGKRCDQCSPGHYKYPECLPCKCDSHGSIGTSCDELGQCYCKGNFDNLQCSVCREGFYNYPICEECNCDPNGVIQSFAGCGSVPAGELCQCKDRVQGRICDECRPLYWNLQQNNELGCEECKCDERGTQGGIGTCDTKTGQCNCKYSANGRTCDECKDGYYRLVKSNVFGCTDCNCDIGGSNNNICSKENGQCACKPRVTGQRCNRPIQTHYFPTLHQFQYEAEDGMTPAGNPVRYNFSQAQFPNYSWRGYAVFSLLQNDILLDVDIQKSSVYQMILRYVNPNSFPIIGKITITPENPNDTEQKFDVLLKPTTKPRFVTVSGQQSLTPSPFVMNPGRWRFSIKTDKSLFLDYFVLLPAAYYEATILSQKIDRPCVIGDDGLCRHFLYPNITGFNYVQGTGAYISKDGGRSQYVQFIPYEEIEIPLINNDQDELMLEMTVSKPDSYIFLIEYVTPIENHQQSGGNVTIIVRSDSSQAQSKVFLDACPYTTPCRHVLLGDSNREQVFKIPSNFVGLTVKGESDTAVGLKSIVAIPLKTWNDGYIKPQSMCMRKNGKCIQSEFLSVPDSKKVEFESGAELIATNAPAHIYDKNTELVYLNGRDEKDYVDLNSKVPYPGQYVFIVQYYQPHYPESKMEVMIQNGQFYEAVLPIKHCPSNVGCRSVIEALDGSNRFSLIENFVVSLKSTTEDDLWLDYLLVVPANQYVDSLLEENKLDQTREFISTCGSDHFHINSTDSDFCTDAVFALTTDYNNGALPCNCDYLGSWSFECQPFGGQCFCKPNIIGRKCEACQTGFFGFPDCKPCNCPSTALCEKETGACICPPRVTGKKCDECMPYTYGFDPISGCEDCNCNPRGVEINQMQCDLMNGSCLCKQDVVGRTCDRCTPGYSQFPDCMPCGCDPKGSTIDICDQDSAECFCKENVVGEYCDTCKDGTFDLRENNDAGCTKCFCFGKAQSCNSANLYWAEFVKMNEWSADIISIANNVTVTQYSKAPTRKGANLIRIDFDEEPNVVYFEAPLEYLGNRLSSYGGNLKYSVFYSPELTGNAVGNPDIILKGSDIWLTHSSIEQPPENTNWTKSLPIVETEFVTINNLPATRELLMMVLKDLQGIYIKAKYWEPSTSTRLSDVTLDYGTVIWDKYSKPTTSIEKCQCTPMYTGNSCEECAKGYYRVQSGAYGGICVPCQCNNHATECDANGICIDCQHATMGDHCEKCIEGYHGNATIGAPKNCLICACPLPKASNNFATSCVVSDDGNNILCNCKSEYYGTKCETCAPGFYGEPEVENDFCKPCKCSGNIDVDDPESCDPVTGKCLKCLNNTAGEACDICASGYFGDAVEAKNCQVCLCDQLGMAQCNSYTGKCECKPGVVGEKCDRCADEYWGFESGKGCTACNCSIASHSKQCDDSNGQCKCKPGVSGKHCDKCASGFWNFGSEGCITCGCNTEYSLGFGCNANTGHCECLPGVIGDKCDHCPYRNVLHLEEGCLECDACTHALLNSTDDLKNTIDTITNELKNKASEYFTTLRLVYMDEKVKSYEEEFNNLDPDTIDLTSNMRKLEELESNSKNLLRVAQFGIKDYEKILNNAKNVSERSEKLLEDIKQGAFKTNATIRHIWQLAANLEIGTGPKVDSAIAEAEQILQDIKVKDFSPLLEMSMKQKENATNSEKKIKHFMSPVGKSQKELEKIKNETNKFNSDLDDLLEISEKVDDKITNTKKLNTVEDRIKDVKDKISKINQINNNNNNTLIETSELLKDTNRLFEEIKNGTKLSEAHRINGSIINDLVVFHLRDQKNKIQTLENLIDETETYKGNLLNTSTNLRNLLQLSTNNSQTEDAVKAALAYSDIVNEINAAENASAVAMNDAENARKMNDHLKNIILPANQNSSKLNQEALDSLNKVQRDLKPLSDISNKKVKDTKNLIEFADNNNNAILLALNDIKNDTLDSFKDEIDRNSTVAKQKAKEALDIYNNLNMKKALEETKNVSRDKHGVKNAIQQIKDQEMIFRATMPNVTNLMENIENKQNDLTEQKNELIKMKDDVQKYIDEAKSTMNDIKVGVAFNQATTLQLPLPDNVDELESRSLISFYFNTTKNNGFLIFLGNPKGTVRGGQPYEDFVAMEIYDGHPILYMDLGNGPESFRHDMKVDQNIWYRAIIDRIGKNVNFTIKEELQNGTIIDHTNNLQLEGDHTNLNLNKDQSKLYVGGYSNNLLGDLKFREFEGEIEHLTVGDTPIGLWNFVEGKMNNVRSHPRNKLLSEQYTGCRFDGEGYVILNAKSFRMKDVTSIDLTFSTFEKDGLIFLAGDGYSFLSVEMRDGRVLFQYRLNNEIVTLGALQRYNDGEPHRLLASRQSKAGKLEIDNVLQHTNEVSGPLEELHLTDYIYFGGYPGSHPYNEVTKVGFSGCISNVVISKDNVDLNANIKSFGIKPGCPPAFHHSVQFDGGYGGYELMRSDRVSDFQLNVKFKTTASDGLIFYITDDVQNIGIALSLLNGHVLLNSQQRRIQSKSNLYNDDSWHSVKVHQNEKMITLTVDDVDYTSLDISPSNLIYKELYIGGVTPGYVFTPGATDVKKPFEGCLSDVTVNGKLVNFANSNHTFYKTPRKCSKFRPIDISTEFLIPGSHGSTPIPISPIKKEDMTSTTTQKPIPRPAPSVKPKPEQVPIKPPSPPEETKPTKLPVPSVDTNCVLKHDSLKSKVDPSVGYRFGTRHNSRLEFAELPDKFQNNFDLSVEFKTDYEDGIMFYASDTDQQNFIALFIEDGLIHFVLNYENRFTRLVSESRYDDDAWHTVTIVKVLRDVKLDVDDKKTKTTIENPMNPMILNGNIYYGGMQHFTDDTSKLLSLKKPYSPFRGCMRNLQMNRKAMPDAKHKISVLPCHPNTEKGIYFRPPGGYLRLMENYRVGIETMISFELKSRDPSGLLIYIVGKNSYFVLEMVDYKIILRVDSGNGPTEAQFMPINKNFICDGNWHSIQAIKTRHVINIGVDDMFNEPIIGNKKKFKTNTKSPIYFGGHPDVQNGTLRGVTVKHGFFGCIRNIQVKNEVLDIPLTAAYRDAYVGMCPTD